MQDTNFKVTAVRMRTVGVLAITAIYAVCFSAIKAGLAYAPPLLFGGLRALIGGVSLLLLAMAVRKPLLPPRRHWGWILVLGLITTTFGFSAMFLSPGRTGAGIASVLGNTQPLIAVVLAALFLGERMTRGKSAALVFGLAGVAFISYPALTGADAYGLSGGAFALAASGGAAVGSVIVKRMDAQSGLEATTAWQLITGSLPLFAGSAAVESGAKVTWSGEFIGLLLFLALAGTAFATFFWYRLVEREDVGRLSLFLFLVPVFGLGTAALLFGEKVSLVEMIGIAFTIAGIGAIVLESGRGRGLKEGKS